MRFFAVALFTATITLAATLPLVEKVEIQPLEASVRRIIEALKIAGEPLPESEISELETTRSTNRIQEILDKHCLVGIEINPESRSAWGLVARRTAVTPAWFITLTRNERQPC